MRKTRFATLYLSVLIGIFFSNSYGQKAVLTISDNGTLEKVKTALLCMQRYSWEHGVAMQGMMAIGDTAKLLLMARESVQRRKPDG